MPKVLATFLHISDLHFGHRFVGGSGGDRLMPELPGAARLLKIAEGLIGHAPQPLDQLDAFLGKLKDRCALKSEGKLRIITTGDLTQDGHLAQLAMASQFLGGRLPENFGACGLEEPNWRELAIPGNHDHWRGLNQPPSLMHVVGPKNLNMTDELGSLIPTICKLNDAHSIEFLRIDTDSDVTACSWNRLLARGEFESELKALAGLPNRKKDDIRVLLMHHSPSYSTTSLGRKLTINPRSKNALDNFLHKHEISMILTGHTHKALKPLISRYTGNPRWPVFEARCGATTTRDRVPKAWGVASVETNTALVHRVIEDENEIWWETSKYERDPADGFGTPDEPYPYAKRSGVRARVWPSLGSPPNGFTEFSPNPQTSGP